MTREIRTLAQVEAAIRQQAQERKERLLRQLAEVENEVKKKVEQAAAIRQAAALIEGAGIPVHISSWADDTAASIDLGENLTRKDRERVVASLCVLRGVLGRRKEHGKCLESARRRTVRVEYSYPDFPGVTVSWVERLPKNAPCKIVRRRSSSYSTLVCEC